MKKKLVSLKNKILSLWLERGEKKYIALWAAFHGVILLASAGVFLACRDQIKIDADLFNMLPKQFSGESVEKADRKLSEVTSRNAFILSCNRDFETAKSFAEKVYAELEGSSNFDSLSLYAGEQSLKEFEDYLYDNRWNFINSSRAEEICSGDIQGASDNAMAKLYSPFTLTSLGNLEMDPFLLTESSMEDYMGTLAFSGTAMTVRDGVLAKEHDGNWYVMVRGTLSKEGSALASKKNGIAEIYSVCSKYEKDGQRFVYQGTSFHSHKSSNAAAREITVISVVSLTVVLVMLLLVFRNPLPIMCSMGSVLVSVATAFLLTLAVFKRIHVLTLVFGTSLIGSCIDYSLHFFINWKANTSLNSGAAIRRYLISGLTLSLVSTEICFAILIFAPFELLKQMSVFSLSGILSSFLSVICIYPLVKLPDLEKRRVRGMRLVRIPYWYNRKKVGRVAVTVLFAFAIACLFTIGKNSGIENNLTRLYKMEGRVLDDQIECAKVLNYAPKGWFILRGKTEEDLLAMERRFARQVRMEIPQASFFCTSDFIPSAADQELSKKAYGILVENSAAQLEYLGEDISAADLISSEWKEKRNMVTGVDDLPDFLKEASANTWLGKIDGTYYSVVMPSFIPEDYDGKLLAKEYGGDVFYINKMKDISHDLDVLTVMILKFFAVAYVLIFVVLKMFYNLKQSLKVISIPLLIILMVTAVFAIAKIHLEFFSITGIILVFGLGLDYVIYMVEAQKRQDDEENSRLEPFAILLSFMTTAVSFGAIALSSFMPVHLMGLAILVGLITAYYTSFFYERDKENKKAVQS